MSDPLIVEAAETLFVPACIYNNTKGDADARVREAFDEPSWNNPVVRFVDAEQDDVIPRVADRWTKAALWSGMRRALAKREIEAPKWFVVAAHEAESHARGVDTAIFGMA